MISDALFTLIREIRNHAAEKMKEKAEEIRASLLSLNQEVQTLFTLSLDGSPLIIGAAEIAKELSSRLGKEANASTFWPLIKKDDGQLLSVIVRANGTKIPVGTVSSPGNRCRHSSI